MDGSDVFQYRPESKLKRAFQVAVGQIRRPEILCPLAAYFGYAAFGNPRQDMMVTAALYAPLGLAIYEYHLRSLHLLRLSGKVFDTKENGSITKPADLARAKFSFYTMSLFALAVTAFVAHDLSKATNTVDFAENSADFVAIGALTIQANRFLNVLRGKWNIVDAPPPEKLPERERASNSQYAPA
jgi:hypothetical protein